MAAPRPSSCSPNETAEIYDPATDRWSLTGDLPITIGSGMIAIPLGDGRVLVSGGGRCGRIFSTAALFNPPTNTWSATASMDVPRAFHSAALLADSRVLVMGGATTDGGFLPAAEVYNPATATWTATNGPETPRGISCGGYVQSPECVWRFKFSEGYEPMVAPRMLTNPATITCRTNTFGATPGSATSVILGRF